MTKTGNVITRAMIGLYLLFTAALALTGCEKDPALQPESYDTIFPGPYLPAYPGSSWVYESTTYTPSDTVVDTVTINASPAYQLHAFRMAGTNDSTRAYVPYWDGMPLYKYSTPVIRYNSPAHGNYGEYYLYNILSETAGEKSYSGINQYAQNFSEVMDVGIAHTAGTIAYSDVIRVNYYQKQTSYLLLLKTRYFARDIGMVKMESFLPGDTLPYKVMILMNHHINN
jgi:hypothetical protein